MNRTLERAISGRNKGIPFPIDGLNDALLGILPGSFTLWAAQSNVGKTRILYYLYWFWVIDYCNIPETDRNPEDVDIFIYAYEMPLDRSLAMLTALYLSIKKGMKFSDSDIMGYKEKPPKVLTDVIQTQEFKEYITKVERQTYFRTQKDPVRAIKELTAHCKKISKPIEGSPNLFEFINPSKMVIILFDHVGNIVVNGGGDVDRSALQKMSKMLLELRNKFGVTIVPIQQANPQEEPKPIISMGQLRESKDFYVDADGFVGIVSPYHLRLDEVRIDNQTIGIADTPENGFKGLQDTFRLLNVMKSRYGTIVPYIPVIFEGAQGTIRNFKLDK